MGDVPDPELRDWVASHGAAADDLARTGHADRPERLGADLVFQRSATLTAREVAERSGLGLDEVLGRFHDLGITVPDPGDRLFTVADVQLVVALHGAEEQGIVRGNDLWRVVAAAMDRLAEAAVAVYVQGAEDDLFRSGASPTERAEASRRATSGALDLGVALAPVFRHHMRQAIARTRVMQSGVSRRELARVAIGFVDLVGSTALEATLDPAQLGDLVDGFESRAFDVTAAGGGRLVKFIGDEIMVAAVDPVAGCCIMLDLIDAFTAEGIQPRGGLVFGEVLYRHGDYYGPVVNLAARLGDAAIPGEVLVDESVVASARTAGIGVEAAGRRLLKGFDAPVTVWSLEREPPSA
ncbi:MAG: adenylate/guanylate cyclase domain-containing protein [Acidimicrobiia bacterium]